MPNPHDVGSAKLLAALGFQALATTSGGMAASFGKADMTVDRETLLGHVRQVAAAVQVPVNVDSERCFAETTEGVQETVDLLAEAGAAGCSIEDWNPAEDSIDPFPRAVERVQAAAEVATRTGIVLTARCENHLHGVDDLEDTIRRLVAYRQAGAEVLYAPALVDLGEIKRLVEEVGAPVNVLLVPGGPSVGALAAAGVRRISTGSTLARIAYGALVTAARTLADEGIISRETAVLDRGLAARAFA